MLYLRIKFPQNIGAALSKNFIKLQIAALAIASSFILTNNAAQSAPKSELITPQGRYEFSPRNCSIHIEEGSYDIEIDGPGTAPDGEIFFFEFSSTANAISINLGVNQPFKHSDRQIKAGQYVSETFEIEVTDNIITVQDIIFRGISDEILDGNGSLLIDCTP